MKKFMAILLAIVILGGAGFGLIAYYPYVFSKTVTGVVFGVERVIEPTTVIGSRSNAEQLFSFAVAVRDLKTGEIFTGSSEDRQWAIVSKNQCAEAKFFPYAPWRLDKGGSYFGVRLIRLFECPVGIGVVPTAPTPTSP